METKIRHRWKPGRRPQGKLELVTGADLLVAAITIVGESVGKKGVDLMLHTFFALKLITDFYLV